MDRYSNGSYIVKDKITETHLGITPTEKEHIKEPNEEKPPKEEEKKEEKQVTLNFDNLYKESLKSVDDRMVVINNFLDDIEGK